MKNSGMMNVRIVSMFAALAVVLFGAGELRGQLKPGVTAKEGGKNWKSIDRIPSAKIKEYSRQVDQLLAALHKEKKVPVRRRAKTNILMRRTYLNIVGRIPSFSEAMKYLKKRGTNKHEELVDTLLASEGYVSHSFNFFADMLRVQTALQGTAGIPYVNYIKESLRDNKPYDVMVRELLTATGYTWENGAAGYYLRDAGMPLDNMSNTARVFLGTRLECAQCHDHPFDKWTQMEFYEMAAYTYNLNTRIGDGNLPAGVRMARQKSRRDRFLRDATRDLTDPLTRGVIRTNRVLRLPRNYKYDDAKPNSTVAPMTIFGDIPKAKPGESKREVYARWMTGKKNPRFTKTIVNRLWKRVFGLGLIEPVGDLRDDSKATAPKVMAFLEKTFQELDFDQKQFMRILYNTQAYQREVGTKDILEGQAYYFESPVLRRMTAEQFWDSLITLVIPEPDLRRGNFYGSYAYAANAASMQKKSADEILTIAKAVAAYNKKETEIRDRLYKARQGEDKDKVASIRKELDAHRKTRPSTGGMDSMAMQMQSKNSGSMQATNAAKWKRFGGHLVRASELRSPASLGHFLRDFGQSDRDLINNNSVEANVLQVLTMFNGPMFREVMADGSELMRNMKGFGKKRTQIDVMFVSVLGRRATSNEAKYAAYQSKKSGFGAVVWALLNTRQFSFVE